MAGDAKGGKRFAPALTAATGSALLRQQATNALADDDTLDPAARHVSAVSNIG